MTCIYCEGTGKHPLNLAPICPICGATVSAMSQHIVNNHTMHEIHTAMSHGKLSLIGGKYQTPAETPCHVCDGTGQVCDLCGQSIPDDGDYLCIGCDK